MRGLARENVISVQCRSDGHTRDTRNTSLLISAVVGVRCFWATVMLICNDQRRLMAQKESPGDHWEKGTWTVNGGCYRHGDGATCDL